MKQIILFVLVALLLACEGANDGKKEIISGGEGTGGSLARFAIVGDRLYTVDNSSLKWFDISTPSNPKNVDNSYVGWRIETIYPKNGHLFIGSQTGMYVYKIEPDGCPEYLSDVQHFYSCDPVVANNTHAYVTLSTGSSCRRATQNELMVVRLNDLQNMQIEKTYRMENPKGLGISGNKLMICDNGIKVFDITDPLNIVQLHRFDIEATDLIPIGDIVMVIGKDGLYQYRFAEDEMNLLSHIPVQSPEGR